MTLIVETGTGASASESFASVAYFKTYFVNIGVDVTTLSDTRIEQLLRLGTNYMEQRFRDRWDGFKVTYQQALSFPRAWLPIKDTALGGYAAYYPQNEVPVIVMKACCEYAYRAMSGDLMPDQGQGVLSEKIDVIEIQYDKYSNKSPAYIAIDAWLAPFFKASSNGIPMVRI